MRSPTGKSPRKEKLQVEVSNRVRGDIVLDQWFKTFFTTIPPLGICPSLASMKKIPSRTLKKIRNMFLEYKLITLFGHALVKRITIMIRKITAFSQGLARPQTPLG